MFSTTTTMASSATIFRYGLSSEPSSARASRLRVVPGDVSLARDFQESSLRQVGQRVGELLGLPAIGNRRPFGNVEALLEVVQPVLRESAPHLRPDPLKFTARRLGGHGVILPKSPRFSSSVLSG